MRVPRVQDVDDRALFQPRYGLRSGTAVRRMVPRPPSALVFLTAREKPMDISQINQDHDTKGAKWFDDIPDHEGLAQGPAHELQAVQEPR